MKLANWAITALLLSAAWAPQAMSTTVLRVQQDADIRSSDPGVNRDANTDTVIMHVVEGLVGYNAVGQPEPLLARSVTVEDEGKVYVFKLRSDVKFHNGAPLTADDVVWSWHRYMSPKTGWRCLAEFDGRNGLKIEEIKKIDAQTVSFRLNQPAPLFLSAIARPDCGMTAITHRDSVDANGNWIKPIGTGPFVFSEWKRREYVSLLKNKNYTSPAGNAPDGYVGSKQPKVDELRFMVISDPATAKTAIASGDIDILPKLPYADAAEFKGQKDLLVSVQPTLASTTLLLQTKDKLLANQKLRQAIAAAIDYKQLVEGATYGLAKPNNSLVPEASPAHTAVENQGYVTDPGMVKRLLAEAGYKGERLLITTNKRNTSNFDVAVIAQAMLQQAGINADIEVLEWGAQQDKWQKGNYQLMAFSYSSRMDPALNFEAVMGNKAQEPRKVWDDPKAIDTLHAALGETDAVKRQALLDDLHRQMISQVPIIPLFDFLMATAYRSNIKGFKATALGTPLLWEVSKQ